ncbi:MAG: hypothetical protein ACRD99_02315 [Nitrososphaera sp.]
MTGRTAKLSALCASCGKPVGKSVLARLALQVRKERRQALALQKKDFDKRMSELKANQKKALTKMALSNRQGTSRIQRNADERARQDRILFEQEFSRLKGAYQLSLAQIKELHGRQSIMIFNQLKDMIANYVREGGKNYDQFVESNQAHILEFQRWLQEELPSQILENVSDAEKYVEVESEPDVEELVKKIGSRDELITKAEQRIRELEGKLASRQRRTIWKRMRRASPPEPYKEEESSDPQHEILSMIREIAQERGQMKSVLEEQNPPDLADSFGSRISKKLSH